jgi:hypothetical protein
MLNSTIPSLSNIPFTNAKLEKLGVGLDNPAKAVFYQCFSPNNYFLRGNDRHFWDPKFINRQLRNGTKMSPQLNLFFALALSYAWSMFEVSFLLYSDSDTTQRVTHTWRMLNSAQLSSTDENPAVRQVKF